MLVLADGRSMTKYQNGEVPASALVTLDDSPLHVTSPKAAAMWYALRRNVQRDYKKTLHISPGKNAYRDKAGQVFARTNACASGNCLAAAFPGTSSHGGTWKDDTYTHGQWVDAMAFDIGDYQQIGEAAFFKEARKVGFLVNAIRPAISGGISEPWHIIVLDPWGATPASLDSEEEDDMAVTGIYRKFWKNQPVGTQHYLWLNKKHHVTVATGPTHVFGGTVYLRLHTTKKGSDTAVYVVQSYVETVKDGKLATKPVGLGAHEIIPTSGDTFAQVPVPGVGLGPNQRLRFRIHATDGMEGKVITGIFRAQQVKG